MILTPSFYQRDDVVLIARQLLGKVLCTLIDNKYTSGIITETEAYEGITDKASHAYNGRMTARTGIMYRRGGVAYVYLCYGIHSLFNVVTSGEGNPHAVLIRSVIPLEGTDHMLNRMKGNKIVGNSGIGPGKLCRLLGIHYVHTGVVLQKPDRKEGVSIWIEERGYTVNDSAIVSGPRIGVDYAGEDALLPYRFRLLNYGHTITGNL